MMLAEAGRMQAHTYHADDFFTQSCGCQSERRSLECKQVNFQNQYTLKD